jgi:hypothetical protein
LQIACAQRVFWQYRVHVDEFVVVQSIKEPQSSTEFSPR